MWENLDRGREYRPTQDDTDRLSSVNNLDVYYMTKKKT